MNTPMSAMALIHMYYLVCDNNTPDRIKRAAGRYAKILYEETRDDDTIIGGLHPNWSKETKVYQIAKHIMKATGTK